MRRGAHLEGLMRHGDFAGAGRIGQLDGGGVWLEALGAGAYELEVKHGRQADPRMHDVVAVAHIHHLKAQSGPPSPAESGGTTGAGAATGEEGETGAERQSGTGAARELRGHHPPATVQGGIV